MQKEVCKVATLVISRIVAGLTLWLRLKRYDFANVVRIRKVVARERVPTSRVRCAANVITCMSLDYRGVVHTLSYLGLSDRGTQLILAPPPTTTAAMKIAYATKYDLSSCGKWEWLRHSLVPTNYLKMLDHMPVLPELLMQTAVVRRKYST